ncbi:ABC transporter ATP-binding protein [Devosia sp. 2618]|uniref:ABC transporter ATP-binding protein n=1 Tax=Devosia sp. 2618 TaxID=3156454 RepID=UPI003396CCE1
MTLSPALLEIDGLTVALPQAADREEAVSDISLSVRGGETLCIVGESGSGKSVMSLAAMGLLPRGLNVTKGRILFEGQDLLAISPRQRRAIAGHRIAMIFQEPVASLNPLYRVGDQVAEVLRLHTKLSRADIRKRVLELFGEVLLPDPTQLYRSYPHQLSGGQCQRVMIAMALSLEPAVLIADEPTTALDVTTQAQILKLIRALSQRHGTAVIFITHDFGVVEEIADTVAVMQQGRLIEFGTKAEILAAPKADYTRQLLAAVPRLEPRAARPNNAAPVLEARHLQKTYPSTRTFKALDDVSLTIRRGETVGLAGESGSGKSTFARAVIRLTGVNGGDVSISGRDFIDQRGAALRRARRDVQIVFQDPFSALDPRQAVGDAIAEGPIVHGMRPQAARDRAAELIEAVGLKPGALDRYPHEFSGGQRQRICIARALALEPDLLIADEALSALDVTMQAQVVKLLDDIQQKLGFAMLFITHDLRVASAICDRICIMRHGRIVEEAEPKELFANPTHAYTRELIAAVPGRG